VINNTDLNTQRIQSRTLNQRMSKIVHVDNILKRDPRAHRGSAGVHLDM